MKKSILIILITLLTAATVNTALGQDNTGNTPTGNTPSSSSSGVGHGAMDANLTLLAQTVNSIYQLAAYIGTVYKDAKRWVKDRDDRPIPHLKQIEATNTATVQPINSNSKKTNNNPQGGRQNNAQANAQAVPVSQAPGLMAKQATIDNVHNTLMQFNYAMYLKDSAVTNAMKDAEGQPYANYANNNSLIALSIGKTAAAGDTLSVMDEQSKFGAVYTDPNNLPLLETPTQRHNDYFDFSGILNTDSYTQPQELAAKAFVKYAAQSTHDLTNGVDFAKLYGSPGALLTLKQNPAYQKYVLMIRSLVAIRSMSLNSLNQLIAERTPMPGLGQAAGMEPTNGKKATNPTYPPASPLQVAEFQANHRSEDPKWYTTIQQATPATLQRETLIVLAEIEHQNYEAHLDRERILAELTALNLQMSMSSTKTMLKEENGTVNEAINAATGTANTSTPNATENGSTTNTTTPPTNTTTPPTNPPTKQQ